MESLHPLHRPGAQEPGERQRTDCERHSEGLRPQVPAWRGAPSARMGALLLWRELSLLGSCWLASHGPGQLAAADVKPVLAAEPCARRCGSLADFLKELPVAVKRAEPNLALLFGDSPPLERRLRLRELQSVFVYSTVLAKKCRVRHVLLGCRSHRCVGVLALVWPQRSGGGRSRPAAALLAGY